MNIINPYRFAAASPYFFDEGFEGTGLPAGWTVTAGTVDTDYAIGPLQGLQSAQFASSSTLQSPDFPGQTDVWAYCQFRQVTYVATRANILVIRDASSTRLAAVGFASGGWTLETNATLSSVSAFVPVPNTLYHIWLRYLSGGTCAMYVSTDGIKPASDSTAGCVRTKAGIVGSAVRITGARGSGGGGIQLMDRFIASPTIIPDNP